jgi:hypothetical protein
MSDRSENGERTTAGAGSQKARRLSADAKLLAWGFVLVGWFVAISTLPDPRPLSAPDVAVGGLRSLIDLSEPVARAVTTIALRGIAFVSLGVFVAFIGSRWRSRWAVLWVLLIAPVLAICSQWINYRYFPISAQVQLSVAASTLGVLLGLALRRNVYALFALLIISTGLYVWGSGTAVSTDLEIATRATGLHLLAIANEIPNGDEGFVTLVQSAFAYAEDNSHGTDPVFTNRAAILALGVILGEERLATMATRDIQLDRVNEFAALRDRITLRGRHDLTRHFWVSAGLVILTDANRAFTVGIGKEMMDATPGGSGFSFVDMMANRAGIEFASSATRNRSSARVMQLRLRDMLTSADFLPDFTGLPEGLYRQEFQSEFGGLGGEKTRQVNAEITRRLETAAALHSQPR